MANGTVKVIGGSADFSANPMGYNAPNSRGLLGLFLLGGTLAKSERNLIPNGVSGAAVNTPLIGGGYATLGFSLTQFTASLAGTTLTITAFKYGVGQLAPGMVVGTQGFATVPTIVSQTSGATGGVGVYVISGAGATIASQTFTAGPGGYLLPGVSDTSTTSFTQIYAVRKDVAATITPEESYAGGNQSAAAGSSIFLATSLQAFIVASVSGTPTSKTTSGIAFNFGSSFDMVANVIDGTAQTAQTYNLSKNLASSLLSLGGPLVNGTQSFRLGSSPAASQFAFGSQCDLALAEFHNVALSLSELQGIYSYFKPILTARGASVN